MKHYLIVRPEAEVDIMEAALWYERRQRGLGHEVMVEIRSAIKRALISPQAFLQVRVRPPVHRILVRRFPYRIFYFLRSDALIVFAVIHAARHPSNWMSRLFKVF